MNDRLEIEGDMREEVREALEREEGYAECPVPETTEEEVEGHYQDWLDRNPGEDMDGDFDTGMRDAGFGTDEDYGYFGGDEF
jgi:hypothetical protein